MNENEFLIELQAKLDEIKSKGNINEDIDKIQNQIDTLKLQAEIDPKSLNILFEQIKNWGVELKSVKAENDAVLKSVQSNSSKEQDAYKVAYKELKKLYDLKIEYAKLGSNKDTDFYYGKAVTNQEKAWKQAWAKTSEPENWDVQKRLELEREELVMQDKLAQAYEKVTNAKKLTNKMNKIQPLIETGEYDKKVAQLENSYKRLGLTSDEISSKTNDVSTALEKLKEKNLDTLVQDEKDFADALKKSQNEAAILRTNLDNIYNPKKQSKLSNNIQDWLSKNTKASKDAKQTLQEYYNELNNGRVSVARLNEIQQELEDINTSQKKLGKLGKSFIDQVKEIGGGLAQWLSIGNGITFVTSKTKVAITELKSLDNILTEISKTSNLTKQQLEALGDSSFDSASKYGKSAPDFLTGIQEMSQSGFYGDKGSAMAEQSLLAQAAGDMTAEVANNYILATNAAYKYNGEAKKLNAVIDGQNSINKMVALYRNI